MISILNHISKNIQLYLLIDPLYDAKRALKAQINNT
jgi:hypothetical protein